MADPRAPRYLTRDQAMAMLCRRVDQASAAKALDSGELDTRTSAAGEIEYRAIEIVELCGVLRRLAEGETLEEMEQAAERDEM